MKEYKESEKSRAERIAEARAEYNASLQELTDNSELFLSALNNMCEFPYTAAECLYIAHHMKEASELDSFENWNEQGFRIKKGEKGLTLLEENKGETVFFDRSQTTAPVLSRPVRSQRLPREKLEALWTCDVRILTATKYEYTKGKTIHYDAKYRSIFIDRSVDIPQEQLFFELSKGIAHAYLHRNNKSSYNYEEYDGIAEAAAYMICRHNDVDCVLPSPPKGLSAKEVNEYLEKAGSAYQLIQSNIDYYYEHGKPQFEKPKTIIRSAADKAKEESKSEPPKEQEQSAEKDISAKESQKPENDTEVFREKKKKPKRKSIKDIIKEKKNRLIPRHEPRHMAKAVKKEEISIGNK